MAPYTLGNLFLFGSGETSPVAGRIFARVARDAPARPELDILETPAGFQPNSELVASKVAEFIAAKFSGRNPAVHVIPARRRGSAHDPDDPRILEPLRRASLVFLGPGSPSYTVRHLAGSLAWRHVLAAWQSGATLVLSSAAAIAASASALPVYEIFKAGADPFWFPGLDLLGAFGLRLAIIPHWNNREGGAELDTSHCFMGRARFEEMREQLPAGTMILGLEEHTAVEIVPERGIAVVHGKGRMVALAPGTLRAWEAGAEVRLAELGPARVPDPPFGIDADFLAGFRIPMDAVRHDKDMPPEIRTLMREREAMRQARNFAGADALRLEAERLGWKIEDTPSGSIAKPC